MIEPSRPKVDQLGEVERLLRAWQRDGPPIQLHPGDLGWYWRFGLDATLAALLTWARGDQTLAVGLLDGPDLLRMAVAPEAREDEDLADGIVASLDHPQGRLLPRDNANLEVPLGGSLRARLLSNGWEPGELRTPLIRDLTGPVEDCGVRIAVAGPEQAGVRAELQRAAFARSTFTEDRWHAMSAGSPYAHARCLIAYDDRSTPVAVATVWSAGPGKPGLLEPMGVHHAHRGHGYGTAVTLAAAAALRDLGSSTAVVCTASSNAAAIATYRSAGFEQQPEAPDLHRSS